MENLKDLKKQENVLNDEEVDQVTGECGPRDIKKSDMLIEEPTIACECNEHIKNGGIEYDN